MKSQGFRQFEEQKIEAQKHPHWQRRGFTFHNESVANLSRISLASSNREGANDVVSTQYSHPPSLITFISELTSSLLPTSLLFADCVGVNARSNIGTVVGNRIRVSLLGTDELSSNSNVNVKLNTSNNEEINYI